MKKLKAIIGGWWNMLFGSNIVQQAERQVICGMCPYNTKEVCTKCGCYIPAKTAWPEEKCPEDKW